MSRAIDLGAQYEKVPLLEEKKLFIMINEPCSLKARVQIAERVFLLCCFAGYLPLCREINANSVIFLLQCRCIIKIESCQWHRYANVLIHEIHRHLNTMWFGCISH